MREHVRREAGRTWLDRLSMHEIRLNQFGNLLACARYLGYGESEAWLAGATAFSFALNVGEDLCPSGSSAWADHKLLPLAANAGLHIETTFGSQDQPDFAARQEQAFAKVQSAIDAGMPVMGAEMDTPEVYLVTGYDDEGHYLFVDFAEGATARLHHKELGFIWLQFPSLGPPADDRTTIREALVIALNLAAGKGFDSSICGTRAYDNWIKGLAAPQEGTSGFGAAYNAACWAGSRRYVVPFLEEARQRLDEAVLAPHFARAIEQYRIVSTRLDLVADLFPLVFGEDQQMAERFGDDARRARAREALSEAKAAEMAGLEAIEGILRRLNSPL